MREQKRLWPHGPVYTGDPVGIDSLALAAFTGRGPWKAGCDLGCGSGILMLLLCRENPELAMTGVELRLAAAEECRENLRLNGLADRCRVLTGDLRDLPAAPETMDLILANPPYFPAGAGQVSPDADRRLMRTETAPLTELCRRAAELLRVSGDFFLVHRTQRLEEVLSALEEAGLTPKRLRLFAPRPGTAPRLFFCQAAKGAPTGLTREDTLFQYDDSGQETEEYRRICQWEEG